MVVYIDCVFLLNSLMDGLLLYFTGYLAGIERKILRLLFGALLGGIYAASYYLNHKTPKPPGCEDLKPQCKGCHDKNCINHPEYHR